jgi:hypothetical protein
MTIYKSQPLRFGQPDGKIPLPNQDEFINLYEVQNKSRKELANHYGVSKGTVDKWCIAFGVKKTKKQQMELAVRNTVGRYREGIYTEKTFAKFPHLKEQSGIFYLIRVYNEEESFYKYGISKLQTINLRYRGRLVHYKYETIIVEQTTLYNAWQIENIYKEMFEPYSYRPKHNFGGWTECYISQPAELLQANS